MEKFKPTWLYIKQHNITGLKYFGKTTKSDPIKYKGSGLYWLRHIEMHGNDVTTIWSKLFLDKDSLTAYALKFSSENKISESINWANLKPENGLDGNLPGSVLSDETKRKLSVSHSSPKSDKWKISASANRKGKVAPNKGISHTESTKQKISESVSGENNPMFGKKHSDSSKQKMSVSRIGKEPANKGIARTTEQKEKQSSAMQGKEPWNKGVSMKLGKCIKCGKETSVAAIGRYHNGNCKF